MLITSARNQFLIGWTYLTILSGLIRAANSQSLSSLFCLIDFTETDVHLHKNLQWYVDLNWMTATVSRPLHHNIFTPTLFPAAVKNKAKRCINEQFVCLSYQNRVPNWRENVSTSTSVAALDCEKIVRDKHIWKVLASSIKVGLLSLIRCKMSSHLGFNDNKL